MAHPKRILVPIDDKEHCMRAFDCKYITEAEYYAVAFNTANTLHVFPKARARSTISLGLNYKSKNNCVKAKK